MSSSHLAFVFPGQGSQSKGMLFDLSQRFPIIAQTFAEASEGAQLDLWTLVMSDPDGKLHLTEYTQPALLAASVALWRCWTSNDGALPKVLAGHSLGEYSALVAVGTFDLADAARLVRLRGQLMQKAVSDKTGAMAAVLGAEDATVAEVCLEASKSGCVVPANFNAPGQVVIAGEDVAVAHAIELLQQRGVRKVVRLDVSVPSHSPLMQNAAQELGEALHTVVMHPPQLPVIHNVDAKIHTQCASIRSALIEQLYKPVRWTACIHAAIQMGAGYFIECGPGKVLSGLNKRIDPSIISATLSSSKDFDAALECTHV